MAKGRAVALASRVRTRFVRAPSRRKSQTTVPLGLALPLIGVAAGAYTHYRNTSGNVAALPGWLVSAYVGYDPYTKTWQRERLGIGLYPAIGGLLLHKVVGNMLGVNRMLSRAGVPYVRI